MIQLDDLLDDCLLKVMDWLPPEDLITMLTVNQRLSRLGKYKMRVKITAVSFDTTNKLFSNCSHLGSISSDKILALAKTSFDGFIIERGLNPRNNQLRRDLLLGLFSIWNNVKSIDFGNYNLTGDFLLEVFQRCPQLECIRMGTTLIKEVDWDWVLYQIGQKIVHVVKVQESSQSESLNTQLLKTVAVKCPNIQRVDWQIHWNLNDYWSAIIKMLPKNCWVTFKCGALAGHGFEDVVDELIIVTLKWSLFVNRYDRLSSLSIRSVFYGPVRGVNFAGLKKLVANRLYDYDEKTFNCLIASQFPRLEEFCFDFGHDEDEENRHFTENDYEALFQRMPSVKKLVIYCDTKYKNIVLPRSSILKLKKLETIEFGINPVPTSSRQVEFLKQFEWWVEEIGSLKKFLVETIYDSSKKFKKNKLQSFKDGIARLKREQSRVEIEFRPETENKSSSFVKDFPDIVPGHDYAIFDNLKI